MKSDIFEDILEAVKLQTGRRFYKHLVVVSLSTSLACILSLAFSSISYAENDNITVKGYFTFEYEYSNKDEAGKRGTFDLHHFNVLTNYQINENSRVFGEIEWEHGTELSGSGGSGEVKLERGWYEYIFSDKFEIRAGKFLTPFGKYNLVHDATPTYTTTFLPSSLYGKRSHHDGSTHLPYSKFQAGIELLGAIPIHSWDMQYWAFIANGRGSAPFEKDDNNNKALGARILFGDSNGRLQFGASVINERESKEVPNVLHTSFAGEATFSTGELVLELEGVLHRVETGNRTNVFTKQRGGYFQAEYAITSRFTPVARLDMYDEDTSTPNNLEQEYTIGINVEVSDRAYLKAETHFYSFDDPSVKSFRMFVSSIAVAF